MDSSQLSHYEEVKSVRVEKLRIYLNLRLWHEQLVICIFQVVVIVLLELVEAVDAEVHLTDALGLQSLEQEEGIP